MTDYITSRATDKLLEQGRRLITFDMIQTDPDKIDGINRIDLSRRPLFRKLYRPVKRNISFDSYIIPVGPTASVTGFLFSRARKHATDSPALIIYLHSGGWTYGNTEITKAVCSNICNQTGAMVLAIDYRLAPANKFPTAIEDCYQAFLWAYAGAKYWKRDPNKVYLMGSSCGGNLAAAVCQMARDLKGPTPAGQILIDSIIDCRLRTLSAQKYADNPVLSMKLLDSYIHNYSREPKDILNPLMSPLLHKDFSRLPPALILAAEYDILYDDAVLYYESLKNADTPANLITREKSFHAFMNYPKSDNWSSYMKCIHEFVSGTAVERISLQTVQDKSKQLKTRILPN